MLDGIKNLFKDGLGYTHTAGLLQQISNILNIVHIHYNEDNESKNAMIDNICATLQIHKDVPIEDKMDENPVPRISNAAS